LDDLLRDQTFTLRQLLRHEAGLADYGELAEYHAAVMNHEPAWSADEMMRRLDGGRLRYSPGTDWRYSNVGYMLIGRLIERLTDLTLDEAVTQRALSPLGLSNVRFAKTRADLQTTHLGSASNYDPAWVYHGLLIGPVSQAALFLDRLFCADLLPTGLLQEMQTTRTLGGPIPERPWITPGYGLGVMQGSIDGGYSLCGHTGCGPGSAIAVYRMCDGAASACCAAFGTNASQGAVEAHVVGQLMQMLRPGTETV
jgi:CubicO group peptidase (beta-lactamase class C family)